MTLQEINKSYNRIVGSLDSKELKNAFDSLQALIAGSREYLSGQAERTAGYLQI